MAHAEAASSTMLPLAKLAIQQWDGLIASAEATRSTAEPLEGLDNILVALRECREATEANADSFEAQQNCGRCLRGHVSLECALCGEDRCVRITTEANVLVEPCVAGSVTAFFDECAKRKLPVPFVCDEGPCAMFKRRKGVLGKLWPSHPSFQGGSIYQTIRRRPIKSRSVVHHTTIATIVVGEQTDFGSPKNLYLMMKLPPHPQQSLSTEELDEAISKAKKAAGEAADASEEESRDGVPGWQDFLPGGVALEKGNTFDLVETHLHSVSHFLQADMPVVAMPLYDTWQVRTWREEEKDDARAMEDAGGEHKNKRARVVKDKKKLRTPRHDSFIKARKEWQSQAFATVYKGREPGVGLKAVLVVISLHSTPASNDPAIVEACREAVGQPSGGLKATMLENAFHGLLQTYDDDESLGEDNPALKSGLHALHVDELADLFLPGINLNHHLDLHRGPLAPMVPRIALLGACGWTASRGYAANRVEIDRLPWDKYGLDGWVMLGVRDVYAASHYPRVLSELSTMLLEKDQGRNLVLRALGATTLVEELVPSVWLFGTPQSNIITRDFVGMLWSSAAEASRDAATWAFFQGIGLTCPNFKADDEDAYCHTLPEVKGNAFCPPLPPQRPLVRAQISNTLKSGQVPSLEVSCGCDGHNAKRTVYYRGVGSATGYSTRPKKASPIDSDTIEDAAKKLERRVDWFKWEIVELDHGDMVARDVGYAPASTVFASGRLEERRAFDRFKIVCQVLEQHEVKREQERLKAALEEAQAVGMGKAKGKAAAREKKAGSS